jgi:hypothetical protein
MSTTPRRNLFGRLQATDGRNPNSVWLLELPPFTVEQLKKILPLMLRYATRHNFRACVPELPFDS